MAPKIKGRRAVIANQEVYRHYTYYLQAFRIYVTSSVNFELEDQQLPSASAHVALVSGVVIIGRLS